MQFLVPCSSGPQILMLGMPKQRPKGIRDLSLNLINEETKSRVQDLPRLPPSSCHVGRVASWPATGGPQTAASALAGC